MKLPTHRKQVLWYFWNKEIFIRDFYKSSSWVIKYKGVEYNTMCTHIGNWSLKDYYDFLMAATKGS